MSSSGTDPAKRIPTTLAADAKLFGRFTLGDVAVALLPGVVVVLVSQVLLPPGTVMAGQPLPSLTLPLGGLAVGLGALFVYLTPAYTSSLDWLASVVAYLRRDRDIGTVAARTVPGVERVHPYEGAIERSDGALLGVLEVEPPVMALATRTEWADAAAGFEDVLDTVVTFPVELFATTRRFPVERYLARYEARLDDADVRANPRLAELIVRYVDWYAGELASRRMTIREHYVVVPVTPAEVRFDQSSLVGQLARLPLLGLAVAIWWGRPGRERHAAMARELDERLGRLEVGLRDIEGCGAHRVEAHAAVELLAAFWTGQDGGAVDLRPVLRTRPVIGGTR